MPASASWSDYHFLRLPRFHLPFGLRSTLGNLMRGIRSKYNNKVFIRIKNLGLYFIEDSSYYFRIREP